MSDLRTTQPWNGVEIGPEGRQPVETSVPVEVALVVEVNGRPAAMLMALPGMERELAVGYCVSSGLIASFSDILLVHHCREEAPAPSGQLSAVVRVQARPEAVREGSGMRLVLSGCGSAEMDRPAWGLPALPLGEAPLVRAEALWQMAGRLRHGQETYRRAGGVHGAGLFAPDGTPLALAEDIGRHNALDKVLGTALMRGIPLEDKTLLSTGRASHEMVTKALRLRVPVVGSLSAVTSLAVHLAHEGGGTLLGRMRGRRFTVYTHPARIG